MLSLRFLLNASLPVVGLLVSSVAAGKNIGSFFASSTVTDGDFVQDCVSGGTFHGGIFSFAQAFDGFGIPVTNHAETCQITVSQEGTSQDTTASHSCTSTTNAVQHQVQFFTTQVSNGTSVELCHGSLSGGWASDFNAGTNISHCQKVRSSRQSSNGTSWSGCANNTFDAYSYGLN